MKSIFVVMYPSTRASWFPGVPVFATYLFRCTKNNDHTNVRYLFYCTSSILRTSHGAYLEVSYRLNSDRSQSVLVVYWQCSLVSVSLSYRILQLRHIILELKIGFCYDLYVHHIILPRSRTSQYLSRNLDIIAFHGTNDYLKNYDMR